MLLLLTLLLLRGTPVGPIKKGIFRLALWPDVAGNIYLYTELLNDKITDKADITSNRNSDCLPVK